MNDLLFATIDDQHLFVLAIVAMGCLTGVVITFITVIRNIAVSRAREQTKREIAAYVAEGTIDPKHAIAMMEAGVAAGDEDSALCGRAARAARSIHDAANA